MTHADTIHTDTTHATPNQSRRSRGLGAAAIAFAILLPLGAVLGGDQPEYDAADQEWIAWFADGGNLDAAIIGMFIVMASVLALIAFTAMAATELRRRLPDDSSIASVTLISGTAAAVFAAIANLTINATSAALQFAPGYDHVPSVDLLKALDNLGVGVLLVGTGWTGALFIAALSWGARSTQLLPGWLTTIGLIAAVVLVLSPAFIPFFAFPVWMLVAGIVLTVRPVDDPQVTR